MIDSSACNVRAAQVGTAHGPCPRFADRKAGCEVSRTIGLTIAKFSTKLQGPPTAFKLKALRAGEIELTEGNQRNLNSIAGVAITKMGWLSVQICTYYGATSFHPMYADGVFGFSLRSRIKRPKLSHGESSNDRGSDGIGLGAYAGVTGQSLVRSAARPESQSTASAR
jgi:hypothetical protein